ncbi:hypothetical protein DFR29_102206 [Tahibacter aquaticus]|uniref:Uncharacterized protein n=1 Tax=Tahibacter aquaticus TaxID=520092 RepID=A0A4V3DNA9_9GAMM|nr:hypothetical protein DFR29_102206 [Tahibacter aquaticus]
MRKRSSATATNRNDLCGESHQNYLRVLARQDTSKARVASHQYLSTHEHPQNKGGLAAAFVVTLFPQSSYLEISTSLVSRRNRLPTTKVNRAITIGYHRPW